MSENSVTCRSLPIPFQMSEQDKSLIQLHGISGDVMEVLLDFVYTETVNVSVENVQELLPAACLLQLTGKALC